MAGSPTYSDEEIIWVLERVLARTRAADIQVGFGTRFGRKLTGPQLRYLKTKYGRDPRFNSPLVNRPPGSTLFPSSTRVTGAASAPPPFPTVRPSPSVRQQEGYIPLAGARRPREAEETDPSRAPKRRREGADSLAEPAAAAGRTEAPAQVQTLPRNIWALENTGVGRPNGHNSGGSTGYPANNRNGVAANNTAASRNASSNGRHTVIDLTGADSSPAAGTATAQATTYPYPSHTAGNQMAYPNAGFAGNATNNGYAALTPTPTSGNSPSVSGILPLPQNMASSFNSPATGSTTGHNLGGRARNGPNVYYAGINDSWTSHGNGNPASYNTQSSYNASGSSNWPGFGGNGSNGGFKLPNLNQSPGSDNDVGYNRADYVNRDAPMPDNSAFYGNVANHCNSSVASQAPADNIHPAHSAARAASYSQQTQATLYSPEIYDQNFSGQEAPTASAVAEPYFPAYPFEAPSAEKQSGTEQTGQHERNARQLQDDRHGVAVQQNVGPQRCEDHQRQKILDQRLLLMPPHTQVQETAPVSATQGLPGINQVAELPEQQLHAPAPAPASAPEQQYVLDQEIVFPNVEDAAAAIASIADLLDGVPIEGPVWDWFDNQPFSSPEEGNPVYDGGWGPTGPLEPFVVPVQPQEALQTSPAQEQQSIPDVPYLGAPTIQEVIDQVSFDWQPPTPATDFNAADFNPAHPFADGLAGGLAQALNANNAGDPLLTQLIEAAYLEVEAEAAAKAAAPEFQAGLDSTSAPQKNIE